MISRKTPQFSAGETLLFEAKNQGHNQSQLKDFIHFIKYCGRRGPIKFKHIEERAELMSNLTLKENLLLDLGFRAEIGLSLSEIFKKKNRPALASLIECISNEDIYPIKASQEDKKIVSLVKVLFERSDYLFLEKPTKYLKEDSETKFFEAFFVSKEKFNQTILITSDKRNLWLKYVNKLILKSQNGHFKLDDIVRHHDTSNITSIDFSKSEVNSKKAA